MKKYTSCLNCDKRFVGCHSNCEDYKQFKAELERVKQRKESIKKQYSYFRSKYGRRYV